MDRGVWQATVHGVTTVGHDLVTKLLNYLHSISLETRPGEDLEKREYLRTVAGTANCCSHYGKHYGDSSNNRTAS